MLLRVLSTCPGTDWVPGQVVQATPEQANEWADGVHATPVRRTALEQATADPGGHRAGARQFADDH